MQTRREEEGLDRVELLHLSRIALWLLKPILEREDPMGTIMVNVDRIQFPKHYIREHKNQEIIKTWTADVKEKKTWYFPPVEVWVPKEGLEKGKTHELID